MPRGQPPSPGASTVLPSLGWRHARVGSQSARAVRRAALRRRAGPGRGPAWSSNVGTPSLLSGAGGGPISAFTTAFASVCAVASGAGFCSGADFVGASIAAPVSTVGSRRTF